MDRVYPGGRVYTTRIPYPSRYLPPECLPTQILPLDTLPPEETWDQRSRDSPRKGHGSRDTRPTSPDRKTHACENITFSQSSLAGGNDINDIINNINDIIKDITKDDIEQLCHKPDGLLVSALVTEKAC